MNSVKMLINKSAELIDKGWDLLGNTNMSSCPVILVYIGESAHYNRETILKTLINNWNNSNYIEEILIPLDYDGTDAVLLKNANQDDVEGMETTGSFDRVIDVCIRQRILKSMQGVFAEKRRIFIEFISECKDIGDFNIINDLASPIDTLSGIELWKSLYVLLDQSEKENDEKAKKLIGYMSDKTEEIFSASGFRQIYLLSNYQCDGSILDENEAASNYRAISDILLLKNNYNINTAKKSNFFELLNKKGVVRTLSYNLVEKPSRDIAIATYLGIISEMINVSVNDDIHKAFNMSEFTYFDDFYRDSVEHRLPSPHALEFLAWNNTELDRLKNYPSLNSEILDQATYGQWDVFLEANYLESVKKITTEAEFEERFATYLKTKFNYKEMRDCFNKEGTKTAIERASAKIGVDSRTNLLTRIDMYAREHARELYYKKYAEPVFLSTLERLYTKACDFEHMIRSIENFLPRSLVMINSKLYSSIGEFYKRIVKEYISDHKEEFNLLMDVELDPPEFLDLLYKFFSNMVSQIGVFQLNFEQELSTRLERMGSDYARRDSIIEEALNSNIEKRRRLNVAIETHCRNIHQNYLGNPRADFVKRLMGDKINNVYDLEKSDCIENLVIYELNSLNDIYGG